MAKIGRRSEFELSFYKELVRNFGLHLSLKEVGRAIGRTDESAAKFVAGMPYTVINGRKSYTASDVAALVAQHHVSV